MMILALFLAAQAAPTGAVVEAPLKLLVLDFRDDGVGANVVRVIQDTLVGHLSKDARIEVLSSEDVRRSLDVEAQKRALGCADDDSCLAEVADALGARLLVHGTAGKLGDVVLVNMSLYDARAQKSIGRETIEVEKLDALPAPLRAAGDRLVAPLVGDGVSASAAPNMTLLTTGAIVIGAGLVGATIGGIMIYDGTTKLAEPDFRTKSDGKLEADWGVAVVGIGGAVALLGAGLVPLAFVLE